MLDWEVVDLRSERFLLLSIHMIHVQMAIWVSKKAMLCIYWITRIAIGGMYDIKGPDKLDMCHEILLLGNRRLRVKSKWFLVWMESEKRKVVVRLRKIMRKVWEFLWSMQQKKIQNLKSGFWNQYYFRWYAGKIPRNRAERLVLSSNLPKGTFLIREREADTREFALTIRDTDDPRSGGEEENI